MCREMPLHTQSQVLARGAREPKDRVCVNCIHIYGYQFVVNSIFVFVRHTSVKFNQQQESGLQVLYLTTVFSTSADRSRAGRGQGWVRASSRDRIPSENIWSYSKKAGTPRASRVVCIQQLLNHPLTFAYLKGYSSLSLLGSFTRCFSRKKTGWCTGMSDAGKTLQVFEVLSMTQE